MSRGIFNKYFTMCLILQLLLMIAFNMSVPLIAKYVVYLGESTTLAGVIAGMFSLLALVYRPISGFLTDRASKKLVLFIGFMCNTLAFFGYAFTTSPVLLAVFRAIHAFGLCVQTTTTMVVAVSFVEQEHVGEASGYVGLATVLGVAVGPAIGVWAADTFGYFVAFVACGIIMLGLFAMLAFLPLQKEERTPRKLSLSDFIDVSSLPPAVVLAGFGFCSGLSSGFLAMMGEERAIPAITVFFLIASLGMIFSRPWAGRMVDEKGSMFIMPISLASETACMIITAFSQTIWPILVAAVCRTFGQGAGQTAMMGSTIKDNPPEKRGVVSSTMYMGVDVGQGFGAMLGGAFIDIGGFTMAYLSGAALMVAISIYYFIWMGKSKNKKSSE